MPSGVFSRAISTRLAAATRTSLRDRHQFQHVPVRIAKIEAAAAAPIIELTVFETPRRAAEHDLGLFHPAENGVELAIGDMEGEMMAVKIGVIVEQQGQSLVYRYRREVSGAPALYPENLGEEFISLLENRAERQRLGHRAKELFLENTGATAGTVTALQKLMEKAAGRVKSDGATGK